MLGFRARRRRRLMMRPLAPEWKAIVRRRVPYYHFLLPELKQHLQSLINVFLDEKLFEGCGGLALTDEMRLIIAAQACILLLGGQSDMFPKLRTILVYPHGYIAPHSMLRPDGTVSEGTQARTGESWPFGNVVLSWHDVARDALAIQNGRNIVFHEFAHQLDAESGPAPGAPVLPAQAGYSDWARVLGREFEILSDAVKAGIPTLLDPYGATSPAEFFAVSTECFFLKPGELLSRHCELYDQLKLYYRQDPVLYNVGPRP
jgi:Mlc titration factor MtfA (ptsG expression regulator)